MYIHPEVWDMFGDSCLSAVQPEKEETPADLSAGLDADYCVYNIIF